jgi:hypothetical protein
VGPAYLIHTLVVTPFFASRAFLATLLVALTCRFAPEFAPWLDVDVLKVLGGAPPWFIHDTTITVLAVLAGLEFLATKDADARRLLDEFDGLLKGGASFAVTYGLLDRESLDVLGPHLSGIDPAVLWALVPASLVLAMAWTRKRILTTLSDADMDDALGIGRLVAWGEDLGVVLGSALVVLVPLLALGLFAATLVGLAVAWSAIRWLDRRSHEPCPGCAGPVHPTAPSCSHCGDPLPEPRAVGVFGQARSVPAPERERHRFELAARGRCPRCSARLTKRSPRQSCSACGEVTFADPAALQAHLARLDRQLPRTMAIAFAFSFVPVLGIVPGVIYYRLSLISGLVRYVPRTSGCLTRWGVRLLNLLLICLQPVPIVGAFTLPIMCLVNYRLYRQVLAGSGDRALATAEA